MAILTLSSMTTEIAVHLKKELDEPFKRLLAQSIDNWRSRLIRNSLQEKPNESKFFLQTLYVPMASALATPACVGAPLCPVMKSTKILPKPVRFGTQLFDYVGAIDGKRPFTETIPGAGAYQTAGKYSRKSILWRYELDYIIIEGHPNLPYVRIDGVFDRPSEVMQFNCDAGIDCDFWDKPYPVTGDIAQQIIQFIVQEYNPPMGPTNKEIEVNPQNQEHAPDGK